LKTNRENFLHLVWKARAAYFFLLPLLFGIVVFKLKPLVEGVRLSFFEANIKEQVFVGFGNYIKMWGDPLFWRAMGNTMFYVIVMVPLILLVPLLIALVSTKTSRTTQSFFRAAFYLPVVSAGIVMSMVWMWIFQSSYGVANYFLSLVGMDPVLWLATSSGSRLAVCIVQLTWSLGIPLILYLSALAAIPKVVYEAAAIDGAGPFSRFFKITLPLIMPTVVYLLIMETIGRFQTFSAILLMTAGGPAYSTTSIVHRLYQVGFVSYRFGEASAYGTLLLVITFIVAFFQFRYLNKKLEF